MFEIVKFDDAKQKSSVCQDIIEALPQWFGIPEANEKYIRDIQKHDVFACWHESWYSGLIALKYHFDHTAEIWWMGVHPDYHRQTIGTALFQTAKKYAQEKALKHMIVNTLSSRSCDTYYARTRDFYLKMGFSPLFEEKEDHENPMMWMLQSL